MAKELKVQIVAPFRASYAPNDAELGSPGGAAPPRPERPPAAPGDTYGAHYAAFAAARRAASPLPFPGDDCAPSAGWWPRGGAAG